MVKNNLQPMLERKHEEFYLRKGARAKRRDSHAADYAKAFAAAMVIVVIAYFAYHHIIPHFVAAPSTKEPKAAPYATVLTSAREAIKEFGGDLQLSDLDDIRLDRGTLILYGQRPSLELLLKKRVGAVYDWTGKKTQLYSVVQHADGGYSVECMVDETTEMPLSEYYIDSEQTGKFVAYGQRLFVVYDRGAIMPLEVKGGQLNIFDGGTSAETQKLLNAANQRELEQFVRGAILCTLNSGFREEAAFLLRSVTNLAFYVVKCLTFYQCVIQ